LSGNGKLIFLANQTRIVPLITNYTPMNKDAYPYDHPYTSRYTFTSTGKKKINKAVDFTHTGIRNIVNLGFGDLLPDGAIDDRSNSNNGDVVKVLATTVEIIIDFTTKFPDTEIFFTGSTPQGPGSIHVYFEPIILFLVKNLLSTE